MKLELHDLYAWSPGEFISVTLTAVVKPVDDHCGHLDFNTVTFTKGEPAETVAAKLRRLADDIDQLTQEKQS